MAAIASDNMCLSTQVSLWREYFCLYTTSNTSELSSPLSHWTSHSNLLFLFPVLRGITTAGKVFFSPCVEISLSRFWCLFRHTPIFLLFPSGTGQSLKTRSSSQAIWLGLGFLAGQYEWLLGNHRVKLPSF